MRASIQGFVNRVVRVYTRHMEIHKENLKEYSVFCVSGFRVCTRYGEIHEENLREYTGFCE